MTTALTYATEEELNSITEYFNRYRAARDEVTRVQSRLREVRAALDDASRPTPRNLVAAAARAMGESTTAVQEHSIANRTELREQLAGLEQRLINAESEVKWCHGKVKHEVHALMLVLAERIGAEYAERSEQLGQLWTQLAALEMATGSTGRIAPIMQWRALHVPGTDSIKAIARLSRAEWGAPVLASHDKLGPHISNVVREIAEHGKVLFGEWPL